MKLLVVMPFYNEEGVGSNYAKEIIKSLKQENILFDYLLIDDCSLDNTYFELKSISDFEKNITIQYIVNAIDIAKKYYQMLLPAFTE